MENPADLVRPASIAKFEPRDRALTPVEIGLMYRYMERVGTTPSIRAAVKLLLLTMVRKSELTNATWSEINFSEALWTIPKPLKCHDSSSSSHSILKHLRLSGNDLI